MLELNINEVLLQGDAAATGLVRIINSISASDDMGQMSLYHKFPFYSNIANDSIIKTDILIVSQKYGLLIIECIDFSDRQYLYQDKLSENLNDLDRLIFSKLLKDAPRLQKNRRELKINVTPALYIHNCDEIQINAFHNFDFPIINSEVTIKNLIINNEKETLSEEDYKDLKATLEGSKAIPKPISRVIKKNDDRNLSKGAILTKIENDIYNFDLEQKRAALFTIDGAQRIRGLAGSGKTVILAMKAAIIHLQFPEARILYTYYTKSLYDTVKRLITRFYRQFSEKDPDWDKIHIMHAWGGRGLPGVYYNACIYNNIIPLALFEAKRANPKDPFDYACRILNENILRKQYDYSLLDEAQDFPRHFYRVCRQITQQNRIVWAYDDFQNILNVNMQNEKETFGKDSNDNWHIDFSLRDDELQDLVLHKCYRNPRKILISAFALGLGIYNTDIKLNQTKIIQRLENNDHWEDLGFEVEAGDSSVGSDMVISRPESNSPLLKNRYLDNEKDIIDIEGFESLDQECIYIAGKIKADIDAELKPEDITVICLDDMNARKYFEIITERLEKFGILTFDLFQAANDNITYKVPDHVTLSTIYKAKGNEAGSVYIVGIDSVFAGKDDIRERNKVFTAMTRALGWLTITGLQPYVNLCKEEVNKLALNEFKLVFKQPSENEVKTIKQDIDRRQAALNKIERVAEDLSKEFSVPKAELVEGLKNQYRKKK